MRASFGTNYGISMATVPDYWYLRYYDAKSMEPSVDWFGFMAYDLHGSWDSDIQALSSLVRGHPETVIREICNDTAPLWFDGLDSKKINFETAYYGRGYSLASPSCSDLLCPFTGPSKPGPCTIFPGVMSLREIEHKISSEGLTPRLLEQCEFTPCRPFKPALASL
jgi:chitinase